MLSALLPALLLQATIPNGARVNLTDCTVSQLLSGRTSFLRCIVTVVPTPGPTPTPTPTPAPTPTPTPTPSPTPTPTPAPTPTPTPSPTPTPPPSGTTPLKAQWETNMRVYGTNQCNTIRTQSGEAKLGSTYYDLELIAYQIAEYTGNQTPWIQCAADAEAGYRDFYVENAAADGGGYGAVAGYWNFSSGLRRDFELTQDLRSKQAVHQLALHASYCSEATPIEWTASATLMRENAYCLNAYLDDEALGMPMPPRAQQMLLQQLDYIDATITGRYKAEQDADVPDFCKGKPYAQPFYIGLAMRSLIKWNSVHPDSRILPAVKRVADFVWDKLRYNPTATSGRLWYGQCTTNAAGAWNVWTSALGNLPSDDLNLLIAPGYAWLWKQTGDPVYRDRADALWTVGVNDATANGLNSKQFNQNYMWSFDFLKYR